MPEPEHVRADQRLNDRPFTHPENSDADLARTVYHMSKFKVEYQAMSADEYDQQFEARELKRLQRKAAHFGLSLVPLTAAKEAVS